MFSLIKSLSDPILSYIKDDPVRPEIPVEFRVSNYRYVGALVDESPKAIVCISLHDFVPESVEDLSKDTENPTTAIFYTIWSYTPGAARDLLFMAVGELQKLFPSVTRFVTLSPKTEMARRFHLKNGAMVLKENESTINYEYVITGIDNKQVI
jgi:hypothetical protein